MRKVWCANCSVFLQYADRGIVTITEECVSQLIKGRPGFLTSEVILMHLVSSAM